MKNEPKPRQLKISILRFNPQESGGVPRLQTYEIERAADARLPHAHQKPGAGDLIGSAAGVRADRRPIG